ncbi:MAG: ATP-binding protein, partial [Bacteroidia bacterium]|nr:ATP-binding protein [Bacteroidia bacterium]NNM16686.1 ATP-binding protein [Bacteroidia bacterium]
LILDNIISNGIKYQSKDVKNPYVDVFIASTPQKLKIKVLDNGIGMDIDENENIQLSMANDRKKDSHKKLGLYIVNEILQKNRGSFFVESVKNSGTMVLIELPNVMNSNNKNFNRYEHNNNN